MSQCLRKNNIYFCILKSDVLDPIHQASHVADVAPQCALVVAHDPDLLLVVDHLVREARGTGTTTDHLLTALQEGLYLLIHLDFLRLVHKRLLINPGILASTGKISTQPQPVTTLLTVIRQWVYKVLPCEATDHQDPWAPSVEVA